MNVRFKYSTYFSAGVYYNNAFIVNNYRVTLSFLTATENPTDHEVGMDRIKYFIHNRLANSVFIHKDNHTQCQAFNTANIPVTTLPLEPFDQVVGIALYSKLNAILEDRMLITDLEISSDIGDNITYLHSDDENTGPFNDEGWWLSIDTSNCDYNFVVDDKIVALSKNKSWSELDLDWDNPESPEDDDNRLVLADFKNNETK